MVYDLIMENGNDYKALILTSDGQCGSVCDEDDLDL